MKSLGLGRSALVVVCAVAALSSPGASFGQEGGPSAEEIQFPDQRHSYNGALAISPLSLLIGMVTVEYQHNLDESLTLAIRGSHWSAGISDWRFRWNGVGAGVRNYWGGRAPEGGYLALNLDAAFLDATYSGLASGKETIVSAHMVPNVMIGRSWLFGGFYMDAGIGLSYMFGQVVAQGARFPYSGFYPSLGFSIGFAF